MEDIEKIRFALIIRSRGLGVDIVNATTKEQEYYFKGAEDAILEMVRKLSDMKYIDGYIQSKRKYMTEEEQEKWL